MRIDVVTIFPEAVTPFLSAALMGKAVEKGLVQIGVHDLREHTTDPHAKVDDEPYGGGPGMVMSAEPFFRAVESLTPNREPNAPSEKGAPSPPRVILLGPQGRTFTQAVAKELAQLEWIVLLCGRYEGVDERVADHLADEELSVGDYVLAGGEAAALVVTDAVVRLIPGVMGEPASLEAESFEDGMLDHPHYTRPASFRGHDVPQVLLSGDHAAVERWRREEAARRTAERRPDMGAC
jgi:tRNA (guanine37-N1)-methyltransferase